MPQPTIDPVFAKLKEAFELCETQYQRDSVQAVLANLFPQESVADPELPIESIGTAMPFARDAAAEG